MPQKPTYWRLFATFFKVGLFSIGGGYAMLGMVRQIMVKQKKWVPENEFVELIAVIQSLPGVFAVNTALSVGKKLKGTGGSLCAAAGAVLPSLIIVLLIAALGRNYKDNPAVERCFKAVRPCVVALILSPALQMIKQSGINWANFYLPLIALGLVCIPQIALSPALVILMFAAGGALYGMYKQKKGARV